jgi:signal peptidase II
LGQVEGRISITVREMTKATSGQGIAFPTIIGVASLVFALDQISKFLVVQNIPLWGSWSLWPDLERLVRFTFIKNTGAAFGMFPQLGNAFTVIALVVIAGIILFHHHLPTDNIWIRLSLGLQLGGAMGNLLDRLLRGYVVDFVDIGFWPIFNMADLSIVLGVCLLTYHLWDQENPLEPARENLYWKKE